MSKLYICNICKKKKQKNEFYLRRNGNLADHICKKCLLEKKAKYREENYDRVRSLERAKVAKNPEKYKNHQIQYDIKNPGANLVRCREYHAKKQRALPPWLSQEDRSKIRSIYKMCKNISKKTGVPHEVDHIVPIKGKTVCGLHVPWNLQVIPAYKNKSKSNKLIEDIVYSASKDAVEFNELEQYIEFCCSNS